MNVMKTMCENVSTKTTVDRFAVSGPMGSPSTRVRISVAALAFVQVMSVPSTMGSEREISSAHRPKTHKAARLKTWKSCSRWRRMSSTMYGAPDSTSAKPGRSNRCAIASTWSRDESSAAPRLMKT